MPRTQDFDTAEVVGRARDLFWDKGFEATSIPDLERVTGLNRSSLYNAFTSKRGLFDAAVHDYLDRVVRPRLRILTDEPTRSDAASRYYRSLADALAALPDDAPGRGCLLLNSAAGFAAHDDAQRSVVESYQRELSAALTHALRAHDPDASSATLQHRARLLTSLSVSALLLSRVDRDEAVAVAKTAVEQLEEWRP
ncbi:TetR/AcrR family transcriptional regulator [Rhodococcus sp. NCIMB 12038]|jgi:TetR/AcrR family transcriptional repressor of nem operon|uniref:TetR/AcrR family transcriptional regulator n=1 Tax=Rhodococcus sp. NCIMB 12038 TaxID=933800 RepID=UPI000B3C605C|nr:TetR/AcrR family transcriptional regulator [Rhodococcus sp. NCIMB 12038]OUS92197.1 TetR family transcriptional regulator [Rhodococcus sp. NCIMB 12038]